MSAEVFEETEVQFDVYGHQDDDGVATLAIAQAKDHAIKLLGIAGAIWPLNDNAFFAHVSEALLAELIAFSIHARRAMEIKNTRGVQLQGQFWRLEEGARDAEYETDLWKALNVILHAKRLEVAAIESTPPQRFGKQRDRAITHVAATSERDGKKLICPSALAYAFLTTRFRRD